jgi:HAD superfamily hydrolase (TIGR01509 family)
MQVGCVLFDWGDTLMIDFPEYAGPMAAWPRVEAVAHARETLEEVRAAGWCTALATNAADSDEPEIRAALARVGLDELVDQVYCSRRVGHSKPSLEFFRFIMRDLGMDASDLVMVGDSLTSDIEGAARAGIRAVWLNPDAAPASGGARWSVIGSLAELPGAIEEVHADGR